MKFDKDYKPYHKEVGVGDMIYLNAEGEYIEVMRIVSDEEWYFKIKWYNNKNEYSYSSTYRSKWRLSDLMNNFMTMDYSDLGKKL